MPPRPADAGQDLPVPCPAPRLHIGRRGFLASGAAGLALAAAGGLRADTAPFGFDLITEAALRRAAAPDPEAAPLDARLAALRYDDYRQIAFRPDHARWYGEDLGWEMSAFHLGWLFDRPVLLNEVGGDTAEPLPFTAADFEYRGPLAESFPSDYALPGVAGFKLTHPLNSAGKLDEVIAFLGASYFRALGRDNRYGLSARGLAIDSGLARTEEFPLFSEFWIERPQPGATQLTLYASLDSASVAGAYRFVIAPGATTTVEITARLFFRKVPAELGIAPLTSMFLFGPVNRAAFNDFRPAVHDSEGLRIDRSDGDVIWRALNNPKALASSYFTEVAPRRFGLHQRARTFADYQDPNARYELRPSVDVEPIGDWGTGAVRLFELPTDLEIHDNIGVFWIPADPVVPGEMREFAYRLHWGMLAPEPGDLAWVARTASGLGGASGLEDAPDTQKFVVDFEGGLLSETPPEDESIAPVVTVSGGSAEHLALAKLPGQSRWRLAFDIAAESGALVEITAHLAGHGRKLSEIWAFQWSKP